MMKLAIHDRPGSFSDRWIELCRTRGFDHLVVDCQRSDIMIRLREMDGLLWHFHHQETSSRLAALAVLFSAEATGVRVFPDFKTAWHFDDKIAQKYLLEAKGVPLAPTWVFYDRKDATDWIAATSFPKVFKLACGAGSENVRLVRGAAEARRLVGQAFGKGFVPSSGYFGDLQRKLRGITSTTVFLEKLKRAPRAMRRTRDVRLSSPLQKGYVYFQEFMAGNDCDTRVTIVGDRAFAFLRGVRPGDFRASGSGRLMHDPTKIDLRCVKLAFEASASLGTQSAAFDFVKGADGSPYIIEISYAYAEKAIYDCPGHWDRNLEWHDGQMWPQDAILDDLVDRILQGGPTAEL